jgi:hypothetical protein
LTIATNHNHKFSECFRIICGITFHGGGDHAHCKVCGRADFKSVYRNVAKPN